MADVAAMVARSAVPFAVSATMAVAAAIALSCSAASTTTTAPLAEAGADAGSEGGAEDASIVIDGPGADGAMCSFNRDCHAALRCECDVSAGCACKVGARGTGRNGVDACTSGNACASSVCVEGPPDAGSFCSDECATSSQCAGVLPLCSDVAFVGRICIRTPPR
jgi:hypothetical protein